MLLEEKSLELLNFMYSPFVSYVLFPLSQSNCMILGWSKKNLLFRVDEAFLLVALIYTLAL